MNSFNFFSFRNGDSELTNLTFTTTGDFTILEPEFLPTEISPGEFSFFDIAFTPTELGRRSGTLVITAEQGGSIFSLELSGQGLQVEEAQPYETIVTEAGLEGADRDPLAIVFSDGLTNLTKYAFNLDLSKTDRSALTADGNSGLPSTEITSREGEQVFQMQYLERVQADLTYTCLLYTSPSPRDKRQSRMPSSA